ncbi:MAG: deoxyribose-phosphate aldolase [Treponema sp.]|jgi:deoxyribose-phosphate aldolase|nr:deoxyribose-phosphate aldolase [Treponema sp.]
MKDQEIFSRIDHTLLKASASWEEIRAICNEAVQYKTASACIPPAYVKPVHETYGNTLTICTVIGFPLGYSVSAVKAAETEQALADGAAEIDMVINLGDVKNRGFDRVLDEITALKKILGARILKVIVETCYLSVEEKIRLCELVGNAGADYIKTSTGFGTAGAALEDIHLFKKHIGPQVKIKAAGGIRTREDLEAFLNAGCSRIGTSSAVALLTRGPGDAY